MLHESDRHFWYTYFFGIVLFCLKYNGTTYVPPVTKLIKELCILPIGCIYGFHMILRINNDYFPKQY
jgi:hypothetical protein